VGKSTLLNRVVGRREAIVEEQPGVTRDRKEVAADWRGRSFRLVDTGGWLAKGDSLDTKVSDQSRQAMAEADAVLLVVDVATGLTEEDARVADLLRRTTQAPVFVVVNKVDDATHEADIWDFLQLGLGDPWPVSAIHGRGTGDLLDGLVEVLPAADPDRAAADEAGADTVAGQREPECFAVAVVGRPNVGKSTLFNRLIGEERAVVHDLPGTTRDTIDTVVDSELGLVRFLDTAGMRRRAKVEAGTEYYSLLRAVDAVDAADVSVLVIDATVGVTHQDQRLAERIAVAGSPVIILLNKWELIEPDKRRDVESQVGDRLKFIGSAPVLKGSALTGRGIHKLIPALSAVVDDYSTRVPTRRVNEVLRAAQAAQPAPDGVRVLYAVQGATDPPTFTLFANRRMHPTYLRYLERRLREELDLGLTPLKLRVRTRA
jgi:GTP-binding protein